jgi:hypothetical protein
MGAPAPATKGAAPATPLATSSNVNLNQWDWANLWFDPRPANGTVFPVLQSVLTIDGNRNAMADDATMAAGATVTVVDTDRNQLRVQVPNLNIDVVTCAYFCQNFFTRESQFSYVYYGTWSAPDHRNASVADAKFVFGYVTPPGAIPNSGTARYSGGASGFVVGPAGRATLVGWGSLTVDFSTHAVAGSMTEMRQGEIWDERAPFANPFNDIAITATQSGNQVIGTTSVTNTPGSAISLSAGASGSFNGELFGPTANELGAVWTLSDGTRSAIGTFTAPIKP